MKKNILIILILGSSLGLFWACKKKDRELVDPVSTTGNLAFVKIFNAAPSFRTKFNGPDSFNVYVNGAKLNGAFLTYNSVFPTATNLYAALPPGPQSIRVSVNGKLTPDSLTLATFNKTLLPNTYYSFIMTDDALTTNEARQMWLTDNFALTDTNNFTIRLVNAVLNDVTSVDVYSARKAANIFTNVAPATATPFVTVPYTILPDTLFVRPTGTQTEIARLITLNGSTTALNRTRAYTLLYKGMVGGAATKVRALTVFAND